MNDLIQITKTTINGAEVNSVNSRDIYEYLKINSQYANWIQRAIEKYDFEENIDFNIFVKPNNNQKDYIVTIDMAKELCMVSNTENGKLARRYFIDIEKKYNNPLSFEEMAKQTILLADKKIKELENKILNDKPKVNFANAISGTTSNIDFETFAKALYDSEGIKYGRNNLMKWFRDNKYLTPKNKPYQNMLDRGLMSLKEGSYINQSTQELVTYTQPRITGKGQMYFTNKLIDEVQNG